MRTALTVRMLWTADPARLRSLSDSLFRSLFLSEPPPVASELTSYFRTYPIGFGDFICHPCINKSFANIVV